MTTSAPLNLIERQPTSEVLTINAPPPLTADETKCVEACVAAIVSVFTESNKNTDDARGIEPEPVVDALAAIACQIIRRGSPLPAGGAS